MNDAARIDERWERVKELLYRAMQLSPEQHQRFLDEACASDATLRDELESLLSAGADVQSRFLAAPQSGAPLEGSQGLGGAASLAAGQILAERYRLIRPLGEGGMGQVWLAEQTLPVRREVALKLIRAGMYDEHVVRLFMVERQSLAMMHHPAIAKVFDAGTTAAGQPYFVMEYVPGLPITDYCDQHRLDIRARLELFIQACQGIQHAHLKAIIHRDLKPHNVLVVEVDGKPVPRIIDFGLAKAVAHENADKTLFTRYGLFIGTPGYISPEQADPDVRDVDTRTDVYSLGVLLTVLLTGLQPFESKRGEKVPLIELLRQLREEDPLPPSVKIDRDRAAANAAAVQRSSQPRQLARQLRGDLDWITLKTLERDRNRRYGSVAELAADLRRHLDHEPIVAGQPSTAYRLRKYVRRHRVAVGVAAGLMLVVLGFVVLQTLNLRRATQERDRTAEQRDRAQQERDRATRITDFMTAMFKVPDPTEARGNSVTAREILDKAAKDIETNLEKDPDVQAQMMYTMAQTYMNLGLYARAHDLAQRAWDTRTQLHGAEDAITLESMSQLVPILKLEGKLMDAEKLARHAIEVETRILGATGRQTLETVSELGAVRQLLTHYEESEKLERDVIALGTSALGFESETVLRARTTLGLSLLYQARYGEAEQEFRQLLAIDRRVFGPDDRRTLLVTGNLALVLKRQGRFKEAEPLYRDNLAALQRTLGPEHPNTVNAEEKLGILMAEQGRFAEADKLMNDVMTIDMRVLPPEHTDLLNIRRNYAELLSNEGRVHAAEVMQRDILATESRAYGATDANTLASQAGLAATLIRERQYLEAERISRVAFDISARTLGPQHPNTQEALLQLGKALANTHRYPEAVKLYREMLERDSSSATGRGNRWSTWYAFACVAVAANHLDDANHYLSEAISRGYQDADKLLADDSLVKLHPNPVFQRMVAQLQHPPASTRPD